MNPELDPTDIGRQLGTDGVNGVVTKAEEYCAHEERHIALKNHASIVTLRGEFALLREEEQGIREQLRNSPPPGDLRRHRRKQIVAGVFAVTLTITSFFLAVFTFAPYRLGWPGYVFCFGIATVVPFLVEKLLDDPRLEPVVKALTAIAAVAGIASLMLLADVRGHLLAHEIQSAPAVVVDDARLVSLWPANTRQTKTYRASPQGRATRGITRGQRARLARRFRSGRSPA